MTYARVCATAVGLVFASQALAKDDLSIIVYPAFDGEVAIAGTYPTVVELQNDGPSTRGVVHMSSVTGEMDYPVDLPQGSQKRFLAYPEQESAGASFSLVTPRKTVSADLPPHATRTTNFSVLTVTTRPGVTNFISGTVDTASKRSAPVMGGPTSSRGQLGVCYCAPEFLPDRLQGLFGLAAVILDEGSERLTDAQVRTLHEYALMGGTLVFQGGASNPTLSDPRWADVLPATGFRPVNIASARYYSKFSNATFPAGTITTGVPTPNAIATVEDGNLLAAERRFGLGRIAYLATNLTQGTAAQWPGRPDLMRTFIRPTTYLAAMRVTSTGQTNDPFTLSRPGGQDPFNFQLPDSSFILMLLATYFVLVVPVNFLVLRKLKRGELAWVTTPLLSFGFAGVLFSTTSGLYNAQLATANSGTIVVEQGHPYGYFTGMSQVFFPKSGYYDLKLRDVDSFGSTTNNTGMPSSQTLTRTDVGQIVVDRMRVPNLAFSGFYYRQKLPEASGWVVLTPQRSSGWTVQNTSTHRIENAYINVEGNEISLGDIAPGQTVSSASGVVQELDTGLSSMLKGTSRVALTAILRDVQVGPQVGRLVEGRSAIEFIQFADRGTR